MAPLSMSLLVQWIKAFHFYRHLASLLLQLLSFSPFPFPTSVRVSIYLHVNVCVRERVAREGAGGRARGRNSQMCDFQLEARRGVIRLLLKAGKREKKELMSK